MALGATPGLGRVVCGRLRESTVLPEKELREDTCLFPPAQRPAQYWTQERLCRLTRAFLHHLPGERREHRGPGLSPRPWLARRRIREIPQGWRGGTQSGSASSPLLQALTPPQHWNHPLSTPGSRIHVSFPSVLAPVLSSAWTRPPDLAYSLPEAGWVVSVHAGVAASSRVLHWVLCPDL